MGKSCVVRIPVELVQRINIYDNSLKKQGISVSKVDVMRRFAENSITPQEDVKLAAKVLGKQPFKFKL
jgi:predicted DNA-binding protein